MALIFAWRHKNRLWFLYLRACHLLGVALLKFEPIGRTPFFEFPRHEKCATVLSRILIQEDSLYY